MGGPGRPLVARTCNALRVQARPWVQVTDTGLRLRAYIIGGCLRALVASARDIPPADPSPDLQRVFDLGHLHEEAAIARLPSLGYTCKERQRAVGLDLGDGMEIEGAADAVAVRRGSICEREVLVEVKSTSPEEFESARADVIGWFVQTRAYAYQASSYMLATGLPLVVVVIAQNPHARDPADAARQPIICGRISDAPVTTAQLRSRASLIASWVSSSELPDCDGGALCHPGTPYWSIH